MRDEVIGFRRDEVTGYVRFEVISDRGDEQEIEEMQQ